MDLLPVVVLVVAAFGAGIGVGLVVAARRGVPAPAVRAARTPRTIRAIDSLVADSIRRLSSWVAPTTREMAEEALTLAPDGTITLLFGDVAGSTSLNVRLGDEAFAAVLRSHDELVRRGVAARRGRVVKTQGDGFMAAFHAPEDAIRCALDLRDAAADAERREHPLDLRVGIHTGRAVTEAGDVFGESVAYAARVAAVARGGEVLVSSEIRSRVEGATDQLVFTGRLFPSRLKGIPGRQQLHRVDRVS